MTGAFLATNANPGLASGAAVLFFLATLIFYIIINVQKLKNKNNTLLSTTPPPENKDIPSDRIDPLTGLANENGLMAWFAEKGARFAADGKGIVILAADLADFGVVEKTYGKEVADAVLIEVAHRVATCTGTDGIAARTSGDEFAAIATVVPSRSEELAAEQAGKLAELIQRPVELKTGVVWIGGSVGAAYGSISEGKEVLAQARSALVKAKKIGRGHYVVHSAVSKVL